jgi:hypothetical protein
MSAPADLLAAALGDRFPVLDPVAMRRFGAFRVAADEALRVLGTVGAVAEAEWSAHDFPGGCQGEQGALL